jgi:general secretion pathway protein M
MMTIARELKFRRRLIFLLVNAALVFPIVVFVVLPIHGVFSDRDDQIADRRVVLARLTAIASQEASVQAIASDTTAQIRGDEFLSGPNENVISADLQTYLKAMTETAGARSRAVQALPTKTIEQIKYSGSRIELLGTIQSVQRAVYAIETAKPYLFITGAVIKPLQVTNRPGVSEEPTIQAQLDVAGAIQVGGKSP